MSDFLRPEAKAALLRWRELLAALALAGLGLWWALSGIGLGRWLGLVLLAAGVGLSVPASLRLRFGQGGGGLGLVEIDEARVTYFGPLGGGIADLGELERLDLDRASHPPHWWLIGPGGQALAIPVDAEGADALIDAFSALPGLAPLRLVEATLRGGDARETLWQRQSRLAAPPPASGRH